MRTSFGPGIDVDGVDRTLHGRVITPLRRDLDVADMDRRPLAPEIDVADVEIDVAHIEFGNKWPAIDVRNVDHTSFGPGIDVDDVDRMLHGRVITPRRRDLDVADMDRRPLAPEIDVADVEIDVDDVDLGFEGREIDVASLEVGTRDDQIDVAGLNIRFAGRDNGPMQSENEGSDVEVATDPPDVSLPAVRDEPLPPVVPDRTTLIRGFRLLAERIPGFTQLTAEETRKMIRLSELNEELIVAALAAADAWDRAQATSWLTMTPDELRELDKTVRDTDDVIRELRVLLRGIEGANRVRKYRRGTAIFGLYRGLQILVDSLSGRDNFMRPYFENMRRAYLKNRKPRKAKAKANDGGTPPSPDPAGGSGG